MLNLVQSILVVLSIVGASLIFLWVLHRLWPIEQRHQYNDLIGWNVTVLGTTYAVMIGFMLFAVWTNFETADGNAEAEANSLVNVVRAARGLPAAQRRRIEDLGKGYVSIMLKEEWPAMQEERFSPASHQVIKQLWQTVTNTETHTALEQTSLDHTLTELSNMTEHRRLRQLQATSKLPGILWTVLIVGAIVTIVSACLFGSINFSLHALQVFMLSLMLSSVLLAISDINRPFQGYVHVSAAGFERALTTLNDFANAGR